MNIQTARPPPPNPCCCARIDGPIAVLTLNRPAARNSLSEAMLAALGARVRRDRRGPAGPRRGARGRTGRRSAPATTSRS